MIRLDVQEYCHGDCKDFDPDVTAPRRVYVDGEPGYSMTDTVVACKNRNRCEAIRRYLLNKLKEESNDGR